MVNENEAYTNGWRCKNCGLFIPWNTAHNCQIVCPSMAPTVVNDQFTNLDRATINDLVRRILALENEVRELKRKI
jgi:hypothetical protein